MAWSRNRKWGTIALLCVFLPTSLLVTFKSTGILPESISAETLTVDPVVWTFQRPQTLPPHDPRFSINNTYYTDTVTIDYEVRGVYYMGEYEEIFGDSLSCAALINATVKNGYVVSVEVYCFEDSNSTIIWDGWDGHRLNFDPYQLTNLTLASRKCYTLDPLKAYVKTVGISNPTSTSYWGPLMWMLKDDETHTLTVTAEILYWTGSEYMKIELPIIFDTYV